jgi:hypothetical protein
MCRLVAYIGTSPLLLADAITRPRMYILNTTKVCICAPTCERLVTCCHPTATLCLFICNYNCICIVILRVPSVASHTWASCTRLLTLTRLEHSIVNQSRIAGNLFPQHLDELKNIPNGKYHNGQFGKAITVVHQPTCCPF